MMVKDGMYINLGIGVPVLIANIIDKSLHVTFESENGILGLGEFYMHMKSIQILLTQASKLQL